MGRLGDRIGRRKMYLAGLVLFLLASVLAGFAPTGEALIGARLLQGLGGAAILPATQSILNEGFRGRDRAIAFGIWGSVIGGVAALGPLIGGWLTTYLSWRWGLLRQRAVGPAGHRRHTYVDRRNRATRMLAAASIRLASFSRDAGVCRLSCSV